VSQTMRSASLGGLCLLVSLLGVSSVDAGDTLVDEVVRMLDQSVEPSIVSRWLDQQDPPTEALSPDDLIRLSAAGASEEIVQQLLTMSEQEEIAAAMPEVVYLPATGAIGVASPRAVPGRVPVKFKLVYRPFLDFEAQDRDHRELYVYIDGELLANTRNQSGWRKGNSTRLERWIEPGIHQIRLLRENHQKRKKRGWHHDAEACPEPIEFEITPGHEWTMTVKIDEPRRSTLDTPLSWTLERDGAEAAGLAPSGPPTSQWPPLCEDLELRVDPDRKTPKALQRTLDRCVRWLDVWADSAVPDRDQVLAQLETDR
jgi:hypothetical protein